MRAQVLVPRGQRQARAASLEFPAALAQAHPLVVALKPIGLAVLAAILLLAVARPRFIRFRLRRAHSRPIGQRRAGLVSKVVGRAKE
jgi:hypothetical protein